MLNDTRASTGDVCSNMEEPEDIWGVELIVHFDMTSDVRCRGIMEWVVAAASLECADGPYSNLIFCGADMATAILNMLREQQLPVVPWSQAL